jgi:uncharacterized protein
MPTDYAQALAWYRKAAAQGDAGAQVGLALMYVGGQGVSLNIVEAYKWLSLAAPRSPSEAGAEAARTAMATAEAAMTPAQIGEARRRASEWRVVCEP